MPQIHPTSVVERGAQIADDAVIGPLCYLGPKVTIGAGTRLVSHVAVLGRTTLGARNTIWPHAVLGADPQDLKFHGEDSQLVIGNDNDIRESVTVHLGTANGGGFTRVGNDNLIMVGAHIAHDCTIGSNVFMANNVGLAGHVRVEDHANIGGAAGSHHFVTFGAYCYVGGMSRIVHDVPPFMIVEGNPSRVRGLNHIGLARHRFPPQTIEHLKSAYRRLYRDPSTGASVGSISQAIADLETEHPHDECVQMLCRFLRNTAIGVHGRYLETKRPDRRRPTSRADGSGV